ncbi:MAG: NAD(P)H-binding protein [Propionibacteriaceae bacterium]|nr:NAD(P)H-binding protein [Propionibacteriaceae bacterium]
MTLEHSSGVILVLGATGYLGRHLVAEAHARGYRVRAVVRDRARAERPGPHAAPSLLGVVDEWAVGDVSDPRFVSGITAGVDVVISALGVTRQRANPWNIDHRANLAALEDAEQHDVRLFTFIHALGADECPAELTKAKSAFARRLVASPITHQVLRPSAYFSDIAQILSMAQKGRVYLMRPSAQVNPIHPADLASFGLDCVQGNTEGIWDVGGPETLTWEQVGQLAFAALGNPPRIRTIPHPAAQVALRLLAPWNPRHADTLRFALWAMSHDLVGMSTGTRCLAEFFRQEIRRDR